MSRTHFGDDKDKVFDNYYSKKTNLSFEQRLEESNCTGWGSAFLYICNEYEYCRTKKDTVCLANYSKIGITYDTQGPWARLRSLQQGNPRDLMFTYLFVGRYSHIVLIEEIVKQISFRKGEWIITDCESLFNLVYDIIEHFGLSVWLLDKGYPNIPYSAQSKRYSFLEDADTELKKQIDYHRRILEMMSSTKDGELL